MGPGLLIIEELRQQTHKAISIRKAKNEEKIVLVLQMEENPDVRFIKETYYLSDAELEARLKLLDAEIERRLNEVDINQIL